MELIRSLINSFIMGQLCQAATHEIQERLQLILSSCLLFTGEFNILPTNTTCKSGTVITLHCAPAKSEATVWYIHFDHAVCSVSGISSNDSYLHLDCGTYAVECVYTLSTGSYTSGFFYVSKGIVYLQNGSVRVVIVLCTYKTSK